MSADVYVLEHLAVGEYRQWIERSRRSKRVQGSKYETRIQDEAIMSRWMGTEGMLMSSTRGSRIYRTPFGHHQSLKIDWTCSMLKPSQQRSKCWIHMHAPKPSSHTRQASYPEGQ